jgi:hypothetical protein
MSESALWSRVRDGLKSVVPKLDLLRVENFVGVGTADVNWCGEMMEGWIELKYREDVPKRSSTPVFKDGGLRPEQVIWLDRRAKLGGRVFILAQIGVGLVLVHGVYASRFNNMTLAELGRIARWKHAGQLPDWVELYKSLRD